MSADTGERDGNDWAWIMVLLLLVIALGTCTIASVASRVAGELARIEAAITATHCTGGA